MKNAVYQPAGTRGSNFTGSPVYGSNDTGKGYITAIDGTKQPAAGETGSTSGGAATSASGSHRVPVPEHLQGGKVGTTWGYEDVARDREEQGAFEQTSTGGGTIYQNTGAVPGHAGTRWRGGASGIRRGLRISGGSMTSRDQTATYSTRPIRGMWTR